MAEKLELGCAVLGALCLIYYVVIVLYAGFGVDFAWFWAAGGIGFLLYGLLILSLIHISEPTRRS